MSIRLFLLLTSAFLPMAFAQGTMAQDVAESSRSQERVPGDSRTDAERISAVASAGDAERQANDRIHALNRAMREQYARTLKGSAARIDPVIVVQFDGAGGTFNLRDGKRRLTIQPVPESYQLAKGVAHAPLGIYSILAPYLETSNSEQWHEDLRDFGNKIDASLKGLNDSGLTGDVRSHARTVLEESRRFINKALAEREFTTRDYEGYARRIFPDVVALRYFATDVQVRSIIPLLEKWRDEMGPDRWRDLSAAVISPHTLSVETPSYQCLRFVMDPERVDDRLIHVGGDYGKDVETAISVLGRLYTDRLAARLTFQGEPKRSREMTSALSSKRDLMADPAAQVLRKIAEERKNDQ